MQRKDLLLRGLARQGDFTAQLKLGELYLLGGDGLARNIPLGLTYLHTASEEQPLAAATIIARSLSLDELIKHEQLGPASIAASQCPCAQMKLACWKLLCGEEDAALGLLRMSERNACVLAVWSYAPATERLGRVLRAAGQLDSMDVPVLLAMAAQHAAARGDLHCLKRLLVAAADDRRTLHPALRPWVLQAVALAERGNGDLAELAPALLQECLELLAARGSMEACRILGQALCGLDVSTIPWDRLVDSTNFRKGSTFLLRAADGGIVEAWLLLSRVASDSRCSVANPQMARFCLEKAAQLGESEAQRRLGALLMREASGLEDAEQAVALLYRAAQQGDGLAEALMASLVLPLQGLDEDADNLIAEIHRHDPWLALRCRLARHFGLTKQEALTVEPAHGAREWGLVVGPNPFIGHARLSAPRAIPAISPAARACLREVAQVFSAQDQGSLSYEGTLRRRSLNQRRLFERLGISESLFFSNANSSERDALRLGPRWAHRCRAMLKAALAEHDGFTTTRSLSHAEAC